MRLSGDRPPPALLWRGRVSRQPVHYLALIETKLNALDQAAALQGWELPDVFQHLRHLLEARIGNQEKPARKWVTLTAVRFLLKKPTTK